MHSDHFQPGCAFSFVNVTPPSLILAEFVMSGVCTLSGLSQALDPSVAIGSLIVEQRKKINGWEEYN